MILSPGQYPVKFPVIFLAEVVVSPPREAELIACGQVNASHFPDAPGIQHAHTTVPVENKKKSRNKHTKGSAMGQAGKAGLSATEDEETVGSSPRQEGPAGKKGYPREDVWGRSLKKSQSKQRVQMLGRRIRLDEREGEKQ